MNAILFVIVIFVLAGAMTYAIGHFVTLRLAVIFWLALCIFGISLFVMPIDTVQPESADADTPEIGRALFVLFMVIPACIGSTVSLIAAWIVKRMRETAV